MRSHLSERWLWGRVGSSRARRGLPPPEVGGGRAEGQGRGQRASSPWGLLPPADILLLKKQTEDISSLYEIEIEIKMGEAGLVSARVWVCQCVPTTLAQPWDGVWVSLGVWISVN